MEAHPCHAGFEALPLLGAAAIVLIVCVGGASIIGMGADIIEEVDREAEAAEDQALVNSLRRGVTRNVPDL